MVKYQGQASDSWPIHIIKPGDEPLEALADSLTRDDESVTAKDVFNFRYRSSTAPLQPPKDGRSPNGQIREGSRVSGAIVLE